MENTFLFLEAAQVERKGIQKWIQKWIQKVTKGYQKGDQNGDQKRINKGNEEQIQKGFFL